jgi:hypothetical protein
MFDQMKNRQTSNGIPMLERPENFKVDATSVAAPETRPQKGYEALLGINPNKPAADAGSGRTAADVRAGRGINTAVRQDVKEKVLAPVVENVVDASGRNSLGERPGEGTRSNEAPAASAAPAEKKDTGIKAVARKDEAAPAVVPSSEGVSKGRGNIPGLSPTMQALYDRSTGRQQTVEEIMAEQKAMKDKYVGPDTRPEERSRLMAEKADLKAERDRQKSLELAQFFASWGSTPGSTLTAAMIAVNKHIPTIIAGEKEARKAQNEVDKIIRELNKAERLEKEGDLDAAYKIKTEQSKKYEELNKTLMTTQGQKEAAQIRATNTSDEKDLRNYKDAVKIKQAAEAKYNKVLSDSKSEYNKAKGLLAALKNAGDSPDIKAQREKAQSTINAIDTEYKNSIADAQALVDLSAGRMKGGAKPSAEKKDDRKVINLDKV